MELYVASVAVARDTLDDLFPAPGEPDPLALLPADRFGQAVHVHEQDRKLCLSRRVLEADRPLRDPFLRHLRAPWRAARGTSWPHWQQGGSEAQTPVPPLLVSSMERGLCLFEDVLRSPWPFPV